MRGPGSAGVRPLPRAAYVKTGRTGTRIRRASSRPLCSGCRPRQTVVRQLNAQR